MWSAQSHEDMYSENIPDLSFAANGVSGWIELKQIPAWPASATQPVKPAHYTPEQCNWMMDRIKHGDRCFVMVKIGDHYHLLDGKKCRMVRKGMSYEDYLNESQARWIGTIIPEELIEELTK